MPKDPSERDSTDLAERLARSYSALMRGFNWLGSEGDDSYRAFSAPFAPAAKLTPETFRAAAEIGRSWSIEIKPTAPWFVQTIQYFHDNQYGSDDDRAIEIVFIHLLQAWEPRYRGRYGLHRCTMRQKTNQRPFIRRGTTFLAESRRAGLLG